MTDSASKGKLNFSRLLWWFLYAAWGAMVAVLFAGFLGQPKGGLRAPEELLGGVHLPAETAWMGIYLNSVKVGFVRSDIEPLPGGGYEVREHSRLVGTMMGAAQLMLLRMTVTTDSALALVAFDGQLDSKPYSTTFSGRLSGDVLTIKVTTGGQTVERFVPVPEPLYVSQAIKPLLQAGRLGPGDSLKLTGFDPVSLELQDLVVVGGELKPHRLWREQVLARELTTRMAGFQSTLYVDREGNVLAEFGPMGMVMRREEMEEALDMGESQEGIDFLALYAVKPVGLIEAPRRVRHGRYRLSGVDPARAANSSDRQRLVEPDSGVIEVSAEYESRGSDAGALERFIRDAPYIESRAPQIVAAAAQAVEGAGDRLDSLEHISRWVFHAVKKRPSAGIPSALAVLQEREGDCNEHSVLFVALARALGIPCRIQLGVVYQAGSFFYHAWPAAWVDGSWVEFEPTFGMERADAARISLAAGDMSNALELVSVIGKLGIEILETE